MTTHQILDMQTEKHPSGSAPKRMTYHLRMYPQIQRVAAQKARERGCSIGAYLEFLVTADSKKE